MLWDGPNVKNRRRKECRWAGDLETGAEHDNVSSRTATVESSRGNADVAQLVAHHLAKVRVASSSLVIRSTGSLPCIAQEGFFLIPSVCYLALLL